MTDEDRMVLKYAGFMGHPFVVICTDNISGKRRVSCECNSLESAERLGSGAKDVAIYERSKTGWRKVKGGK